MSRFRKILLGLGVLAAVPAVAYATNRASDAKCGRCCGKQPAATSAAKGHTITCPITGQTINDDECPLCKGQK